MKRSPVPEAMPAADVARETDLTPGQVQRAYNDFGRNAISVAKQVLMQKVRDAEREMARARKYDH